MKRSVQEIVELLVFGLIALLVGTGLLWLVGWVFDLVGVLFKFFAALIWSLLRFIVPVAVIAAIVYAVVRLVQQGRGEDTAATGARRTPVAPVTSTTPQTEAASPEGTSPAGAGAAAAQASPADEPTAANPEEESHPTASEVWVPPQPSPPTASRESGSSDDDDSAADADRSRRAERAGHEDVLDEPLGPAVQPGAVDPLPMPDWNDQGERGLEQEDDPDDKR